MESTWTNDRIKTSVNTNVKIFPIRSKVLPTKLSVYWFSILFWKKTRCDDLTELYEYANIQSDRLTVQIEERKENREFYETVANTIDEIVDSVCSTGESSSCLSIELSNEKPLKSNRFNDEIDVLISHLCDDDQTRQVRSTIQNRYERFMSTIDKKIQAILLEHQSTSFFPKNSSIKKRFHSIFRYSNSTRIRIRYNTNGSIRWISLLRYLRISIKNRYWSTKMLRKETNMSLQGDGYK